MSLTTNQALLPDLELLRGLSGRALSRAQQVGVILGMPKHECRFHGICKIVEEEQLASPRLKCCQGPQVKAWLVPTQPNYHYLLIPRRQLPLEAERYHFHRETMTCQRPVACGRKKPQRQQRYLRPGVYRIRLTKNYYLIRFRVGN